MEKKDDIQLNPVSGMLIAYLTDPLFKSLMYVFGFFFSLTLSFYLEGFDMFAIAEKSTINELFNLTKYCKHLCLTAYLIQCFVVTLALSFYASKFVACGTRLTETLLKNTNLGGKVALITGGYSGIGLETALQLLKWQCRVVILGRNKTKATNAIEFLKNAAKVPISRIDYVEVDLNDLKSIKLALDKITKDYNQIDFLINNAGVDTLSLCTTTYGYEETFSSNYLGHYYLTTSLLDMLVKSEARIINVSSIAHFRYNPKDDNIFKSGNTTSIDPKSRSSYYGRSKLFNIWFTHALQRKFGMSKGGPICVSCGPGIVDTPLLVSNINKSPLRFARFLFSLFLKTPRDGAATTLYLVSAPRRSLLPGAYYYDCKLGFVSQYAHDYNREEELLKISERIVDKIFKK